MTFRVQRLVFVLLAIAGGILGGCGMRGTTEMQDEANQQEKKEAEVKGPERKVATFGNGCFWCTEAVFAELEGVHSAISGYSGGKIENPTYQQVSSGATGHAEVVQITYDPKLISFEDLLQVFWKTHDPTTLNQQGADHGTQYRSAVFYHDDEQKELAEKYKAKLDEAKAFDAPIVTEITKFTKFYPAEDYHQNYNKFNGGAPYCRAVIAPKLEKFRAAFADKLKK